MTSPITAEGMNPKRGSYDYVRYAAAIEPKKPPTDIQVHEKAFRSSAPLPGYFLA